MRRVFALSLTLMLPAALLLAAYAGARTLAHVKPGSGSARTKFVISFRSPDRTGTAGLIHRSDVLGARGPNGATGCVHNVSISLRPARLGQRLRITLDPSRHGGVWCTGRFRGQITETQTVVCPPVRVCPQLVLAPRTIARFSFRVRPAGTGGGGGGGPAGVPSFAGLTSALTCSSPLPHKPAVLPRMLSFRLTWTAATDPATPSSAIVYDIYYSPTSGGEDFSNPTWTTDPGATTYTAAVSQAGPAYFVVRARDQAGREDSNTIEHEGVNQCG